MLCLSIPSYGADHEFRGVVHAIESSYGVHHMHIPLLGVAMFFARPEGVSRLKLAIFENFNARTDPDDVKRLVERSLGSDWFPLFVSVPRPTRKRLSSIPILPVGSCA